jgi:hypothetical protein
MLRGFASGLVVHPVSTGIIKTTHTDRNGRRKIKKKRERRYSVGFTCVKKYSNHTM